MPSTDREWPQEISASRAIFAVLAGVTVGASLDTTWYLFKVYEGYGSDFPAYAVSKLPVGFVYSWLTLLIELVFFGLPVWVILNKTGKPFLQHAVLAGALAPFFVSLAIGTGFFTGRNGNFSFYGEGGNQWIDGAITSFGLRVAIRDAAETAILGAIVVAVIWRVARSGGKRQA